jgi:hypothetical protein
MRLRIPSAWELLPAMAALLERVGEIDRRLEGSQLEVVVRKEHRGDRPLALAADVIGEDPERAVLGGGVAGEEAAVAGAGLELPLGLGLAADCRVRPRPLAILGHRDYSSPSHRTAIRIHHMPPLS